MFGLRIRRAGVAALAVPLAIALSAEAWFQPLPNWREAAPAPEALPPVQSA